MGFWDTELFSNDITCDVRDTYIHFLEQQLSNKEAYLKICREYKEIFETEDEFLFWYALADTQWTVGRLMPEVKERALQFIGECRGKELWKENQGNLKNWSNTLLKLQYKLESPMPREKIIKKPDEFICNPWNVGDIYSYQFHTEKAKKVGLFGKYILFQKVGNVEYYEGKVFTVIQVFDQIYDIIPQEECVSLVRILPLISPPGVNGTPNDIKDYIPSFEWYMKATMIYEEKNCFPQNYFSFIGNKPITEKKCEPNDFTDFFWEKDGMEEWLVDYYLAWKNVKY